MAFLAAIGPALSAVSAVAGVAGSVVAGIGAYQQAQAQSQAAQYNAEIQQRNAGIVAQQGKMQTDDLMRQQEQQLGRIRASYGAAGVAFSGDALGVYQDSASQANYDIAKTRYNTSLREMGDTDQAQLDTAEAQNYSTSAMFGLVSGGINGIASGAKALSNSSIFQAT